MATADEWRRVAALVRANKEELPRLYALADDDGPRFLARFKRRLGAEKVLDLVRDLLATRVDAIVDADEPRALFCTALQRRAISWLRRGDAAVLEDAPASRGAGTGDEDERQRFLVDAP